MSKDPACLFFIDKWFTATKEMKSDCRGWYLNLILHQFDKKDLPNDIEELANLADVRVSEFDRFKQVFEQVLKHKFKQNENNRLENDFAKEIILKRDQFLNKRSNSGKLSYVLKYFRSNFKINKALENYIKENITLDFDIKNEQVLKQVFKQISELYINVNKDNTVSSLINIDSYSTEWQEVFKKWLDYKNGRGEKYKTQDSFDIMAKRLMKWSNNSAVKGMEIIENSIVSNYAGLFEPKASPVKQPQKYAFPV